MGFLQRKNKYWATRCERVFNAYYSMLTVPSKAYVSKKPSLIKYYCGVMVPLFLEYINRMFFAYFDAVFVVPTVITV